MTDNLHVQIEDWRKRLLDLSKRNRLINCKLGARGAIELEHPTPAEIWQQLVLSNGNMTFAWKQQLLGEQAEEGDASPQLSMFIEDESSDQTRKRSPRTELDACRESPLLQPNYLLTQMADSTLATRLNRIALNAKTSISEQGVNVLFLAFGLLEWYESPDSEVAILSPLLLVPTQLDRIGPESLWKLSLYEEDVAPNQCLHELLRADFRVDLPEIPEEGLENPGDREAYFREIMNVVRKGGANTRWEVHDKAVLGTFSFQKLAMWQDLGNNADKIAAHDLCRAIAGDRTACVSASPDLPSPTQYDECIHPKEVHTILDADSSQLEAILAVDRGMSLVIDGPPGTGKSQTIANVIAQALGRGAPHLMLSHPHIPPHRDAPLRLTPVPAPARPR